MERFASTRLLPILTGRRTDLVPQAAKLAHGRLRIVSHSSGSLGIPELRAVFTQHPFASGTAFDVEFADQHAQHVLERRAEAVPADGEM